MESMLNIPILPNPTRQKIWRVVLGFGLVVITGSLCVGVRRIVNGFDPIIAPQDVTSIHLVRSLKTIEHLRGLVGGMDVIPGVPVSLNQFLNQSHRTVDVWFAKDGKVTVILDGTTDDLTVKQSFWHGVWSALLLGSDGVLSQGTVSLPFIVDEHSMTLRGAGLLTAPKMDETISDATVFSASVSGDDIASLIPKAFTQNTPGFSSFFSLAALNGISAHIDRTDDASSYTLTVPLTNAPAIFTTEEGLTSLARELVEVPTIDGVFGYLDDGGSVTTLRSREVATVAVRDDAPYRFITATSSRGNVSIIQTPITLSLTNRTQDSSSLSGRSAECLAGSVAFVRPVDLFTRRVAGDVSTILNESSYHPSSLSDLLWRATEIGSSTSATKICFGD